MALFTSSQALEASPTIHKLLARLHAESEAQETSWSQKIFYVKRLFRNYLWGVNWNAASDDHMRTKFVALEQDKCQLVYLLARAFNAKNIVEAGTSFGVSTIYLALAVGQNVQRAKALTGEPVFGKVVATEKEPSKAVRAREHWKEAGPEVEDWIELREGDLRETLTVEEGLPGQIDMLLLDIWTPLALPALEIIRPRLSAGALVVTDNTIGARPLYKDLLDYLHDPANGFKTTTVPYSKGLEVSVYLPSISDC
ncbi:S-adenosyl-L-methionine-dependent methyltransferase [Stachybotrys elegans]|uniref:S-adenosyl-L-methionine-dependent methyltransferase n=1 Tax=Stachybotrys elegans TaxID=80388 RepID=A0A8K0SHC2_9HYPO|nr:S-adenosyl-L-methionine-dependent methyltransferase [Stachybotrys elegans]